MHSRQSRAALTVCKEQTIMANVLVVDDSAVDRHRVGGLLEKQAGWTASYAADAEEALAFVERQVPDAVVADLRMPGMNGLELVEALKARYPFLPVILTTAFGSEDIAILALQRGAANYVPKRNLARSLVETVEHVLEVTQTQQGHQRLQEALARSEAEYILGNDTSLLSHLLGHVCSGSLTRKICDANKSIRLGVALREALLNAIQHGNLEVDSGLLEQNEKAFHALLAERRQQSPYQERRVYFTVKESPTEVVYIIRDEGSGFDPTKLPDPTDPANLCKPSGRGLLLIHTFMDEVHFNKTGNQITLIKRRGKE
jgi:CheY-like chemotaxis protein/anti-sigma regulatory factor (Ser/Thr protein kinase)